MSTRDKTFIHAHTHRVSQSFSQLAGNSMRCRIFIIKHSVCTARIETKVHNEHKILMTAPTVKTKTIILNATLLCCHSISLNRLNHYLCIQKEELYYYYYINFDYKTLDLFISPSLFIFLSCALALSPFYFLWICVCAIHFGWSLRWMSILFRLSAMRDRHSVERERYTHTHSLNYY